jgi:hypothetical protein
MNDFCGFLYFFTKTFSFFDIKGSLSCFGLKHLKRAEFQDKYDAEIVAVVEKTSY